MNCCPSLEELQQLLAEQLIEGQQQAIEIHVQACAACQQTLARLSEGGKQLDTQLFRSLPAAPLAPWDRDFVRRLKQHPPLAEETAFRAGSPVRKRNKDVPMKVKCRRPS